MVRVSVDARPRMMSRRVRVVAVRTGIDGGVSTGSEMILVASSMARLVGLRSVKPIVIVGEIVEDLDVDIAVLAPPKPRFVTVEKMLQSNA